MVKNNESVDLQLDNTPIPYNERNKLIKKSDIQKILKKYDVDIEIRDINIFYEAFTHKTYIIKDLNCEIMKKARQQYSNNIVELQKNSYERLEFLGDTVLKMIISMYLFERYPNRDEGFMTRLKTKIENRQKLSYLSKEVGLDEYIIISKQIETMTGRTSDKILEDIFEAFIGALCIDTAPDITICTKFVRNILEYEIDFSDLLYKDTNYKDQLLRHYHKNKWGHPEYDKLHEEGPPHKRTFTCGVKDNDGNYIGIGIDKSKKKAEQIASMKALEHFNLLNPDQVCETEICI